MVQVPEVFTKFVSSFAGCMGGNPDAPIWLVCDYSFKCDLPMAPTVKFANPQTDVNKLLRPLQCGCKFSESVGRLVNAIVGNEPSQVGKVFSPAGEEKQQPVLMLSASPVCIGLLESQAWIEKPAVKTDKGVVTMAEYTGLPTFKDFINFLIETRGALFRQTEEEKSPKIILCRDMLKANDYFKMFGADRTNVQANDFFLMAPVKREDGSVRTLLFVTDMLGFGADNMNFENELELRQAGEEIRHYAHNVFGDGWLGNYAGVFLK